MTLRARTRILTVHGDAAYRAAFSEAMSAADADITVLAEATRVVPVARSLEPHLILLGQDLPILTGTEILRSLRSFTETESIPTVLTLERGSETEILRALRAGASDALPMPFHETHRDRLLALIADRRAENPAAPAVPRNVVLAALLRMYRADRRHGTLTVNPGTPFEGRATFEKGELVDSSYGPVTGTEALRDMLEIDGGVWRFVHGKVRPSAEKPQLSPPSPQKTPYRPRVLIVDDEPALRRLFELQLSQAGFDTAVAEDGERGFEAALHTRYDVILADLSMPRIDGWGMLQRLKADQRTREVPVVLISAHDDDREALRSAKAGASDYLRKTGRADEIISHLNVLMAPRNRFWMALDTPASVPVEVHQLGQWTLRALAQRRSTGELELADEWGKYRVCVEDGVPLSAQAWLGRKEISGLGGAAALLVSEGASGTFRTQAVQKGLPVGTSMDFMLAAATRILNDADAEVFERRLRRAPRFAVDESLFELYRRIGNDASVSMIRLILENGYDAAALAQQLDLSPAQVALTFRELVGRGILRFAHDSTTAVTRS